MFLKILVANIFSNKSLLEETILRAKIINKICIIIGSLNNIDKIKKICKNVNGIKFFFIFEEIGKNTASAIWMGAKKAYTLDKNCNILILSADHYISNNTSFANII